MKWAKTDLSWFKCLCFLTLCDQQEQNLPLLLTGRYLLGFSVTFSLRRWVCSSITLQGYPKLSYPSVISATVFLILMVFYQDQNSSQFVAQKNS